jgi:hypothetical protein
MSRLRSSAVVLLALLPLSTMCAPLQAGIISVTLEAAGPVNDGTDYVLPYLLRINGNVEFYADCYDFFDDVSIGQNWQAYELTLPEVGTSGQFAGVPNALTRYKNVAWLSAQTTNSEQNQIDLQHDIWNVFDPGKFLVNSGMTEYLTGLAQADFNTYDFSRFTFLEGVTNTNGGAPVQAFIIGNNVSHLSRSVAIVPEPGSLFLALVGSVVGGMYWIFCSAWIMGCTSVEERPTR